MNSLSIKKHKIDKNLIKKILIIAIPIVLEQLLSSSFGVVDTIMVKYIDRGISGVGLASQISNVVMTIMFACATGVGMYIAQYFGDKDKENIKNAFSLLLFLGFVLSSVFMLVCLIMPRQLLSLFTKDQDVLEIGVTYIRIACFSYMPNLMAYAFVIAYRNVQKTINAFIIQLICSAFNVLFNWLLIFGIWIFPELGIRGAAIATVLSCSLSLIIHIVYGTLSKKIFMPKLKNFINGLNFNFSKPILKRSIPLLINETLFSIGILVYVAVFNRLGSDQYEAYRISEVITQVAFSASYGMTAAVQAITGASLGSGNFDEAKRYGNSFLILGVGLSLFVGLFVFILARPLVMIFASDEVSEATIEIAKVLMYVCSLRITLKMYANILLAVFRAGGKTKFVMVLDCLVMWLIGVPIAIVGYNVFKIDNISILYLIMQLEALVRIGVGLHQYFKYDWLNNIINKKMKVA